MTFDFDISEHVTFLASPALEGRAPGSDGSRVAREYITNTFRGCGLTPLFDGKRSFTQDIDVDGKVHGVNVGGIIEGKKPGYILVGAHYDHFSFSPGADDNAAAVAQVLVVAEYFGRHPLPNSQGMLFLAFDCEEPPHFHQPSMGSRFFVEHCPVPLDEIQVAIVLDLTGHLVPKPRLEHCLFAIGMEHATATIDAVLKAAKDARGIQVFPASNNRVGDMSDHHAFRINKRPFIFLSCGRTEHYHTRTDTIENLNLPKANAIASFLANLVETCADGNEFEFNPEQGQKFMEEAEAAALSRLLGRHVTVPEVDGLVDELSRGL
ncbi:MAG: M28 family peptidase [Candidatus Sigynarchaeota archaeon]